MRQRKLGEVDDGLQDVVFNVDEILRTSNDDNTITISKLREAAKEATSEEEDEKIKTLMIKEGSLDKRRRDLFDGILPQFCDCRKKWKLNRHLVCLGMYIYRFEKDEEYSALKGVPIPLLGATVKLLLFKGPDNPDNEVDAPFCFEVSTLRKTYVYRAANDAEARSWIQHFNQRKMQAHKDIKQHSKVHPAIQRFDRISKELYAKRMEKDLSDAKQSHEDAQSFLSRNGMSPMHIGSSNFKD